MRDLQKTLTQEQKDTVYEFVASWIKSGRKLDDCIFQGMKDIIDGEVTYTICMSNFNIEKLHCIFVNNKRLGVRIMVPKDEVKNKSLVNYIENYMAALMSMDKGELSDEEFNDITNLEVDVTMSRSKKVKHLMDKINE